MDVSGIVFQGIGICRRLLTILNRPVDGNVDLDSRLAATKSVHDLSETLEFLDDQLTSKGFKPSISEGWGKSIDLCFADLSKLSDCVHKLVTIADSPNSAERMTIPEIPEIPDMVSQPEESALLELRNTSTQLQEHLSPLLPALDVLRNTV